jgi:hypothetical protein
MQITIQVQMDVARRLHQRGPPTTESEALNRVTKQLGVVLEPMHPGTADPDLTRYFTVEAPDQATAERVIAGLQQSKAIEAAYVKPPDAMP